MPEIKFSCPQCGQHLSGNEQWSGHQIQCPACGTAVTVPGTPPPPAPVASAPHSPAPQRAVSHGARLAAGATQVARASTSGPMPRRQAPARPPRSDGALLKYGIYAIVLAGLAWAGYTFVPSWVSRVEDSVTSKPAQAGSGASRGVGGPLGDVNDAMDVSDALDGGFASPSRPAANPPRKATNDVSRARPR